MAAITLPPTLAALAAVTCLALGAGQAWSAPPPILRDATPPGRVGRVARLSGTVSGHAADADQWSPATPNTPVTSGDAFWTEQHSRADIQIASNRLTLAPQTELDMSVLDDHAVTVSEPQGEIFLVLRTLPDGDVYTVQTPRGAVQIATAGRYAITAGDAAHPTVLTVVEGAAQITGPGLSLQVGPRQTATVTGSDPLQGTVGPIAEDPFLTAMLAEERPAPRPGAAVPVLVAGMTGSEDLQAVGDWAETPQYGAVWYPPVQAGWVPYREGRWSFTRPWGWTWVDAAPWGFAPFHYGRWAEIEHRWGWIPIVPGAQIGPGFRGPIYAPALVGFIGFGLAGTAGQVGWVPLGPREPYVPPYRTSPAYIRNINAGIVLNVNQTNIANRTTIVQNYFNRGAATVVPATAMVRSSPIAAEARLLAPEQLARGQAQVQAPVRPSAATAGVTPVVARQFNFVPPPRPAQPAPGPALRIVAPQAPIPPARPASPTVQPVGPLPDVRPAARQPNPAPSFPAVQPSELPPRPMPSASPAPARRFEPRPFPIARPEPRLAPQPMVRPSPQPAFRAQPVFRPQPPRPVMPAFHPQPRPAPPHLTPPHGGDGPHHR